MTDIISQLNTISLATNNSVYTDIINHGQDGFLTDELSWFDKLEYIYLNKDNLSKIIERANKKCHKLYDYDKQVTKIENIYDSIIKELGD